MRKVSNCCWWMVAAVAAIGVLLAPLAALADSPETVTWNGRQYKVVRGLEPVKTMDRASLRASQLQSEESSIVRSRTPSGEESVSVPSDEPLDGLREYAFKAFEQKAAQYYSSATWRWGFDLELSIPTGPAGKIPAITEIRDMYLIEAQGVAWPSAAVLIEAYDFFDYNATPYVHDTYLGGVVLDFGSLTPDDQKTLNFTAPAGDYFFTTGNDTTIFISLYTGKIVNGEFVANTADSTLALVYKNNVDPTVGGGLGAFYFDGESDSIYDRRYTYHDGPYVWSGSDTSWTRLSLYGSWFSDCNRDGIPDVRQVQCGTELGYPACQNGSCTYFKTGGAFQDPFGIGCVVPAACDVNPENGIPDECDSADCNNNGVPDGVDIALGNSQDCNGNTVPDECEIDINSTAPGGPFFCTEDCDPDCNNDGIPDECQLARPGVCDTLEGICDDGETECTDDLDCPAIGNDCDGNFVPDDCQIADGSATDCDNNGVPDFCEHYTGDCNGNGIIDICDIVSGYSSDGNDDGIPDECFYFSFCWVGREFEEVEPIWGGYTLGDIDGQPFSQPNPLLRWSVENDVSGKATVAMLADDCNANGYALKLTGNLNSTSTSVTSPMLGNPSHMDDQAFQEIAFFDYKIEETGGSLTSDATEISFVDSDGDLVTYLEYAVIDFAGEGEPPNIQRAIGVGVAGSSSISFFTAPGDPDAFRWKANECSPVAVYLLRDGKINGEYRIGFWFGGDSFYVVGTAGPGTHIAYLDSMTTWSPGWSAGAAGVTHNFYMDNLELCVFGPDMPFSDCNGNGIADEIDIAQGGADCNNNGILDACEVLEGALDCDLNGILDECDINANGGIDGIGGVLDGNANGILDFCEPSVVFASTIGFETIEGFVVNESIIGQLGWWGGTFGPTPADINVVFQGGSNQVKFDPDSPGSHGSVFGSPLYVGQEPDVMQWNFQVTFGSGANYEGEPLWVDLTDFYDSFYGDKAPSPRFALEGPTTGLVFVRTGEAPSFVNRIYTYKETGATFDTGLTWGFNQTLKFKVRIENTRKHVVVTKVGEPAYTVDWAGGSPLQSGLRHVRHISFLSNPPTTEKLIDRVYRKDGPDCDYDGIIDSEAIALGLVADLNGDGIPDRCQDCNADCVWISGKPSLGPVNIACLDPEEIAANPAIDSNNNGIPDVCDLDITGELPYIGWKTHIQNIAGTDLTCEQAFHESGIDPAEECYVTRRGGGGWSDCDNFGAGNGVLDSIDICGPSPDPQCVANTLDDCNNNGFPDGCDIVAGGKVNGVYVLDKDGDGRLDECVDCNGNGIADYDDIDSGLSTDVIINATGEPGSDGIPDECCVKYCGISDLNCDLSADLLDYGFLQQCSGPVAGGGPLCGCADMNGDGVVDEVDVVLFSFFLYGPL